MQNSLADLLKLMPARATVGMTTCRYWLATGFFGAVSVQGGGGTGRGYARTLDFHGTVVAMMAGELYGFGLHGVGFEQALLSVAREVRNRWRDFSDLCDELPTLLAAHGEGSIIELAVIGRSDEGDPLYQVRTDWNHVGFVSHPAAIRLNLALILEPLVMREAAAAEGK